MKKITPSQISSLLLLILLAFSSCSSSSAPDPDSEQDAKEIKAKTKSSLDLPELELFSNAKRQYQSGLYSVSRESFGAIKDNYPTGPYAEYSELKVADTHFENSDYQSAGLAYEEFTKNRPASSALAYAFLRAARSFELASAGIGRDPTPLQKALELYNSLIENYPNSVYTPAAKYYRHG
jgi:outer membrane protein assembly factor BamD